MCTVLQGTEALLASVQSTDPAVCLAALRAVKNAVIGNSSRKLLYTRQGAVPMYAVEALQSLVAFYTNSDLVSSLPV